MKKKKTALKKATIKKVSKKTVCCNNPNFILALLASLIAIVAFLTCFL